VAVTLSIVRRESGHGKSIDHSGRDVSVFSMVQAAAKIEVEGW
jgi:hypothetical protein